MNVYYSGAADHSSSTVLLYGFGEADESIFIFQDADLNRIFYKTKKRKETKAMKKMKKFVGLLLAMVMVLSMSFAVMAEETESSSADAGNGTPVTYSIIINNTAKDHTYEAYQIFTGDLSNKTLSNIVWGAGVTEAGQGVLGDAATKAQSLKTEADAKAFADEVAAYLGTATASTSTLTDGKYVISGLAAGYYLVKDKDGTLTGDNDSYTKYILEVVEDSEVSPKSSVPSVEKKVDDVNDSNTSEDEIAWNDSADYDIGDDVPFQLKAKLASNVEEYAKYKIVFHDTLSKGLTYKEITKVTVDGKEVETGYTVDTVVNEDETTTLTITFDNVKNQNAINGSVVIVEYIAILDNDAEIGAVGNPNEVYLEYSNNPNWKPEGSDGEDNDGDGEIDEPDEGEDDEKDEPTGETPVDKVIVFTYKVVVNKVDENEAPLTGAGFTLYKKNAEGEYVAIGKEVKGEAMTTFEWKGLDDGDYKLEETTTPAGYNTITPIEFTITAEHELKSADPRLTELDGGDLFSGEVSTGTLSADVENKSGTVLPETGGIGTTIFYTLGGVLVLAAVVLLITRRRMNVNA